MTALRITPLFLFGSSRALLIERNLLVYKHGWMIILSGFFEPLFYLLSIGFGLGAWSATSSARAASRSRTPCSLLRPCSPRPR